MPDRLLEQAGFMAGSARRELLGGQAGVAGVSGAVAQANAPLVALTGGAWV